MSIVRISRYHKLSDLCEYFGIIFLLLYAFSRLSWGFILPSIVWGMLLVSSLLLFLFAYTKRKKAKHDIVNISIVLGLIIIIFDNYSRNLLDINYWISILPYFCVVVMMITCSLSEKWITKGISISVFFGMFFSSITIVCYLYNNLYYDVILPVLQQHYTTSFTPNPIAGFTAHYSTNGIYLAVGLLASLSVFFETGGTNINQYKMVSIIKVVIILLASLICGKRGILLSLVVAVFLAYYNYNSNKQRSRIVKLFALFVVLIVVVYLLNLFVPFVSDFFNRFVNITTDNNITQRFLLWAYALNGFLRKPFLGNGWRWVMNTNGIFRGADAHNVYIQLLAETGIIGALVFYTFFAVVFYRANKLTKFVRKKSSPFNGKEQAYIYFSFMLITYNLVYMLEGTSLYMPECLVPYFMSCAVIQYYWRQYKLYLNETDCE